MPESTTGNLSRRERQIMDIVYESGQVTAAEVRDRLAEAPSYSAVRALLRVLVVKGHLQHRYDGPRYVYSPTVPREEARASALRHLVQTFFDGSAEGAVAALLGMDSAGLSEEDYDRLETAIQDARKDGR